MYIRQKKREKGRQTNQQTDTIRNRESLFFKSPFSATRTGTKNFPSVILEGKKGGDVENVCRDRKSISTLFWTLEKMGFCI